MLAEHSQLVTGRLLQGAGVLGDFGQAYWGLSHALMESKDMSAG